jgi:hypothetical protein
VREREREREETRQQYNMKMYATYTMGTGTFPEVKRQKVGVDYPLHLAPRLKKE